MPGDGSLGEASFTFWQQSTQSACVSFYLCKPQKGSLPAEQPPQAGRVSCYLRKLKKAHSLDRRKAVSEQMHIHGEEEQNARDGGSEQEFEQSEPNVHAGSEGSTAQPLYGQKANEMRFRTCTGYLGYPFKKSVA